MANQGPTSQTILVVGGGIAGITAAVEAAETGYEVILLERGPALGGRVAQLNRYFPKLCHPTCGLEINYQRIRKLKNLRVVTMASVAEIKGNKGNYAVAVRVAPRYVTANCTACGACAEASEMEVDSAFDYGLSKTKAAYLPHEHAFPMRYIVAPEAIGTPAAEKIKAACKYDAVDLEDQGETFDVACGAVIWATGWEPYDPVKLESYSYSLSPDIITNVQMERLANHDGPTAGRIVRPSNGEPVKKVAMIQCAGSRDHNHLPYCSRICCLGSLKHAAYVREQYADAEVDIYYIDLRAHDKLEAFYQRVAADPQVNFIKSKPASIEIDDDGYPVLHGEDTITRELYDRPYDLVVLATGMKPAAADGCAPPMSVEQDEYGFLVPSLNGDGGIFPAGVAAGPLDVSMSVQSATAAALKAIQAVGPKS
ncbi:MAG: CoB--CoM heterodisulfide reductase iron-sulfur subunit A family protein [Rhodospirillales bacterium]|nr:MAG: CoB--CoM heterodisulfide reductase iron-sulfur subunit A family protein [Rhodospirillales bacterium]